MFVGLAGDGGTKNCCGNEIAGSMRPSPGAASSPMEHVDRPSARPTRAVSATRCWGRQGPAVHQLSRRPQRGFPGHLQAVLPGVLRLYQGGGPCAARDVSHIRRRPPRVSAVRSHFAESPRGPLGAWRRKENDNEAWICQCDSAGPAAEPGGRVPR